MQILTINAALEGLSNAIPMTFEIRGLIASSILKQVFLPFSDFSFLSVFLASTSLLFLIRNKQLIISALNYSLGLSDLILDRLKK